MVRRVVSYILFFILSISLFAQPIEFSFQTIGKESGLSNSNTNCITQDTLGYIWIGTQDGLNRFDGLENTVFFSRKDDSLSLPHNDIRALYTDSEGTIWIGTANGLCRYLPEKNNFSRTKIRTLLLRQDLLKVESIGENSNNQIYFSNETHLFRLNRTENTADTLLTIPEGEITNFCFDDSGNIWIGAFKNGGLYKFSEDGRLLKWFRHNPENPNSLSANSIFDIVWRNNKIWIATEGGGINVYNPADQTFKHYFSENYYENFARSLYVDKSNRLWKGDYTGMKLLDDNTDQFYGYYVNPSDPNSIKSNAFSIFEDMQGNYWVLYNPGGTGLSIQRKGFKVFGSNKAETWHTSNAIVSAIEEDYLGNLWSGNPFNGIDVFYWPHGTTYRFNHDRHNSNSLGSGAIFALAADDESMWIGSYAGGLQNLDKELKNFRSYVHDPANENSIAGNDVRSVILDHQGKIWIALHGKGVDRFDKTTQTFTHYTEKNSGLANDWTFQVIEDSKRNIWVATAYGLSRLMPGETQFKNYFSVQDDTQSLSYNEIITVFEDSMKRVWVGTSSGLNLYDPDHDNFIRIEGELKEMYICSILDDNKQNIWISTLNGLFCYNPTTGESRKFDVADGLPTNEFFVRSSFKNLFNDLFFGSINGIVAFDPNNLYFNSVVPNVLITKLKLFNKEVDVYGKGQALDKHISMADEMELKYDQNMFTLEFMAINMIHPEKNSYAYMLEGFDDDWHQVGSRREATYTNLNPGTYNFRVKASNNDGVWNEEGASIKIIVHPPWWLTWWFRLLGLSFSVFLILLFYWLRTKQLRRQKNKLQKEVKERTAELSKKNSLLVEKSNSLNEINVLMEERQQEILKQKSKLEELNTSKDRLFSIIAHDLTSPFNSILGLSELLFNAYEEYDEEERIEMAKAIFDSSRSVFGLLDNLLNWARSQTNRIKFNPEPIDILQIVDETLEIFKYRIQRKELVITSSNDTNRKAFADLDMTMTIIRNLISNAIKFTPLKGSINIDLSNADTMLKVSISDTGTGISEAALANLFDISVSSSTAGTEGEKGSGIGLILTREFIHKNGGEISIESEPGKGSTFSFTLPAAK